jgi:hypothetical protein
MKIALLALLVLTSAAAFGQQTATISAQPSPAIFVDHPLHAEPHAMGTESPIAGTNAEAYTWAHGEQPLWQFGPVSTPTPLGDVARAYRKEKLATKKAEVVLEKQGS